MLCLVTQLCPTHRPQGLWPTRLLCPWDSPGKNTGVGCHFLLQGIFPRIEPVSPVSSPLQADSLHIENISLKMKVGQPVWKILLTVLRKEKWKSVHTHKKKPTFKTVFLAKLFTKAKGWKSQMGTSLVVYWLRLCASNTGGLHSIPCWRTRFHMLQLTVFLPQHATTKSWYSQINKSIFKTPKCPFTDKWMNKM